MGKSISNLFDRRKILLDDFYIRKKQYAIGLSTIDYKDYGFDDSIDEGIKSLYHSGLWEYKSKLKDGSLPNYFKTFENYIKKKSLGLRNEENLDDPVYKFLADLNDNLIKTLNNQYIEECSNLPEDEYEQRDLYYMIHEDSINNKKSCLNSFVDFFEKRGRTEKEFSSNDWEEDIFINEERYRLLYDDFVNPESEGEYRNSIIKDFIAALPSAKNETFDWKY